MISMTASAKIMVKQPGQEKALVEREQIPDLLPDEIQEKEDLWKQLVSMKCQQPSER